MAARIGHRNSATALDRHQAHHARPESPEREGVVMRNSWSPEKTWNEECGVLAAVGVAHAAEIVALAPEGARDADLDAARAALTLADGAAAETAPFEKALAANPDDHQARYDLAGALAGQGRLEEAADELLTLIARDQDWNDQAARRQLLVVFEAAGFNSEVAKQGRRRLSSILFS